MCIRDRLHSNNSLSDAVPLLTLDKCSADDLALSDSVTCSVAAQKQTKRQLNREHLKSTKLLSLHQKQLRFVNISTRLSMRK